MAQLVEKKSTSAAAADPGFAPWIGKIPWKKEERLHTLVVCLENYMDCTVHESQESNMTEQVFF